MEIIKMALNKKEVQICKDWFMGKNQIPTKEAYFLSGDVKVLIEQEQKIYISKESVNEAIVQLGIPHEEIPGMLSVKVFLRKDEIFGIRKKNGKRLNNKKPPVNR